MNNLHFIASRNELAAVPKTDGGFNGHEVNHGGNGKNQPPNDVIYTLILHSQSFFGSKDTSKSVTRKER